MRGANHDRHKRERRDEPLQKRKLDFERMLRAMRHGIFAQQRKGAKNFFRQRTIDGRHSQRRLPGAIGKNCKRSAARKMPRAEEYHAPGNFNAPVNFSRDRARIHISGVRNEACARADFLFMRAAGKKRIDVSAQAIRIIWIKTAGDSRRANHGEPVRLISFWKVCP